MRKSLIMLVALGVMVGPPITEAHVGKKNHPGWRIEAKIRKPSGEWSKWLAPRKVHRRAVRRAWHGKAVTRYRRVKTPLWFAGRASWYGEEFRGRTTACGEPFNPDHMTTAHRTLPCGTMLVVSRGKREVLVRVNDRGPFIEGRVLDLSRAAFARLAPLGSGVIDVKVRKP